MVLSGLLRLTLRSVCGLCGSRDRITEPLFACTPPSPSAPLTQGFLAACGNGTVRLYEKSTDPKEVYKRAKRFKIADEVQNVVSLAVSPSEDSLVCAVASGQTYTLSLANSDIVKV